jgi:bile acid:Na+ symporter, BASS family
MVMDLATLVGAAIQASVFLIVFSLGLGSTQEDALYLLRRPRQLVRSLLSMNVVMPLVAAGLAAVFDFPGALNISLVALAVSPVPPILPKRQLRAGGRASYAVGLLMVAALLAIVFIPLALKLIALGFGKEAHVPEAAVARLVAITVLVPIAAGIVVRRLAPAFAARAARPISLGAMALLGVVVVLLLIRAWRPAVSLIGDGHVLALAAFVAIGLIVGHLLGGPDPEDRVVLALATASRHPGVALAIAAANFPQEKRVMGAILLYLLISLIVEVAYLAWRRRQLASVASAART